MTTIVVIQRVGVATPDQTGQVVADSAVATVAEPGRRPEGTGPQVAVIVGGMAGYLTALWEFDRLGREDGCKGQQQAQQQ